MFGLRCVLTQKWTIPQPKMTQINAQFVFIWNAFISFSIKTYSTHSSSSKMRELWLFRSFILLHRTIDTFNSIYCRARSIASSLHVSTKFPSIIINYIFLLLSQNSFFIWNASTLCSWKTWCGREPSIHRLIGCYISQFVRLIASSICARESEARFPHR